jgi:hypothetical protein
MLWCNYVKWTSKQHVHQCIYISNSIHSTIILTAGAKNTRTIRKSWQIFQNSPAGSMHELRQNLFQILLFTFLQGIFLIKIESTSNPNPKKKTLKKEGKIKKYGNILHIKISLADCIHACTDAHTYTRKTPKRMSLTIQLYHTSYEELTVSIHVAFSTSCGFDLT